MTPPQADGVLKNHNNNMGKYRSFFSADSFSRLDNGDDGLFYRKDRFVSHLDSLALSTVEKVIGELIVEDHPVILDVMAGLDSHTPPGHPERPYLRGIC
jgi:hypothetical protein